MTAKAPTLAWLLTALACFVVGLALAEGRHRADALTAGAPVEIVVTVEVAYPTPPEDTRASEPRSDDNRPPTPTPMPTLAPAGLYPDPSSADFPDSTPPPCDTGPVP